MNAFRKIFRIAGMGLLCLGLPGAMTATEAQSGKAPPSAPQKAAPPKDKVRATKTVKGVFLGFEVGDYMHTVIKKSNGEKESYYLDGQGLEYFLALNKGKSVTATYQVVDTYIEEAGGVETVERITAARTDKQTSATWWKQTGSKYTPEQLEKKYGKLVQQATLTP